MKICIIGGGAAGISASIAVSKNKSKAIILEKTPSLLNKFILAGGGRCNISNEHLSSKFFNGGSKNFINNVLKGFGKSNILSLLKDIQSKYFIEKDGRIYTGDAKDTANKIIKYAVSLGTEIRYKAFVERITPVDNGLIVNYKGRNEFFDRVIIATGGKSYPETGSDGYCYAVVESLGHNIVHPLPGLVPLYLKPNPFSGLQGISVEAKIYIENKRLGILFTEEGKILFTHKGISGPLGHNISGRYIRLSREKQTTVYLSLLPSFTESGFKEIIQKENQSSGKKKLINLLCQFLPDRLSERIMKISEIDKERRLAELKKEERERLIENLFKLKINISGSAGFKTAQITTGGVSLNEIHSASMESKIVKGLFFAGEIMDVDGLEGGYNLHWAFATGYIAGQNAAKSK